MTENQEKKLDTLVTDVASIKTAIGGNKELRTKGISQIVSEHDIIINKHEAVYNKILGMSLLGASIGVGIVELIRFIIK